MSGYLTTNLAELWLIVPGFDDLLLTGENVNSDGFAYTIDALDDGASWGQPEPIDNAVQRWMTDGAVAITQGHDNRTLTFQVRVSALTSRDLEAGEAALAVRSGGPALLKWIPPEGDPDAAATIFEVWTWHLDHGFDGIDERNLRRTYATTFTAKPWARSEVTTLSPAPALSGTTPVVTLIDACGSTTNWVGNPTAITTSSGALHESRAEVVSGRGIPINTNRKMTRTAAVTGLGALKYLVLDLSVAGAASFTLKVTLDNGDPLELVATVGTQRYYQLPAGMTGFTTLVVVATCHVTKSATVALNLADVSAADTIGGIGSRKQLIRSLEVGGSVKTAGSIHVESPSATALGNVLVYTCPDDGSGYSPPLRQYRTAGNTVTADGTCASGNHEALVNSGATAGGITYTIPAGLLPEGTYVLVGRFIFGSAATISTSFVGGNAVLTSRVTRGSAGVAWAVLNAVALPGLAVPAESTVATTVFFSATATAGTHTLDELYLLDVTRGTYSLVTGITKTDLWLDAPDVDPDRNRPAIYVGNAADRSDAATPTMSSILARGDHDLDPLGALMFSVTDGVNDAAVNAEFFHRWHTHAGD